jgi:hypothetical protein
VPIAFHPIDRYLPGDEHLAAEAWYVRMFGGVGGKRSNLLHFAKLHDMTPTKGPPDARRRR